MNANLNGDISQPAVMDSTAMEWQRSPAEGIWRKRLEHVGSAEAGRVTSLVRFDPGAHFPFHGHPDGEELFVLEGVFQDEHGNYGPGTFTLSPDGSDHAPWSDEGCLIFVKLRQMPGGDRDTVVADSAAMPWTQTGEGREIKVLYAQSGYDEEIRLVRLAPGTQVPHHEHPGGEEVFVISGEIADEAGRYGAGTWFRLPDGSAHAPWSDPGCLLLVKVGGLPRDGA